ncbi:zinc finger protein [Oryctes borbonicus]|uniref:Zinc finger protein n=1 Tax=Oryctes borbonicus TaxID=1629725 RepID=A0A0T6BBV3_9SCAR|nr:zinc finger protein [Oryctes borbonicus]
MRHLEIKEEDLNELEILENDDLKVEIPEINLEEYEQIMKNEFVNENSTYAVGTGLVFDLNEESELVEVCESTKKIESRKNRRKSLLPQRVQAGTGHGSSTNNNLENSHALPESIISDIGLPACPVTESIINSNLFNSDSELPENDDLLQDIDEDDIFKGIQNETEGEKLDDEMMDNVKEEWKAHWGVKCNMCEKVFPYRAEFDNHYINSYSMIPVYTCSFCNKTVEKYTTFRSHCYRHITEGRYKCKECSKGFSLQSLLQVHILGKHSKAKPFMCEECGKSFVTKPGLKIHLKKHKNEIKEDYPCVVCGKVLHTRGGLTSHMNVHRLGKRFMCDICGKTFTQKVNMQQHCKQHTGDKPHGCDKCGKTFAEKSHLARHYSFHSEQRPYKCEVCQKMYKTERCLKVHSMVHAAERPFICKICSKRFLSSTKLKQHHNIHTGEKPYACNYCERKFTNYPNWLKHTRRRHKVDHKTGKVLEVKNLKTENNPPAPSTASQESRCNGFLLDQFQQDIIPNDIAFTKTEELLLQQTLLNYPLIDDKFTFHPQIDLIGGSANNSMGLLVPYFQSQCSSQSIPQNSLPFSVQLNELMSSQLIPSTFNCN